MKINDREILAGIEKCDSHVIEYVYQNFFPSIRHFICSNSGNVDDAQDVFQDALNVVFEKVRRNDLSLNVSFGTYLFSVTRNIWLHELRRTRKHITLSEDWSELAGNEPDIIPTLIKIDRQTFFFRHLELLSPECRKILQLMLQEVTNDKIKETMGYSSDQYTKNRKNKCFQRLMERISADPIFKELCNEKFR